MMFEWFKKKAVRLKNKYDESHLEKVTVTSQTYLKILNEMRAQQIAEMNKAFYALREEVIEKISSEYYTLEEAHAIHMYIADREEKIGSVAALVKEMSKNIKDELFHYGIKGVLHNHILKKLRDE